MKFNGTDRLIEGQIFESALNQTISGEVVESKGPLSAQVNEPDTRICLLNHCDLFATNLQNAERQLSTRSLFIIYQLWEVKAPTGPRVLWVSWTYARVVIK